MLLEYFQMIDSVETVDMTAKTLRARSVVPAQSPVFEGHFPGYPLVPGVLLIETMAQASGFLVLAVTDFAAMPFLMTVDGAKMRSFVEPEAVLDIDVVLEHDGSGFAVTKAKISSAGKRIADAQLKLRTVPFDQVPLGPIVRKRAEEVGLTAALAAQQLSLVSPPESSKGDRMKAANDVVITGVGIVTSQGVGVAPHVAMLTGAEAPAVVVETERFAPYPVHPLPVIDWSAQIAKRGDQRQMENWQRLGVFSAGLALDDAGLKDDTEACGTMDMIVAAGGGERDIAVDSLIVDEGLKRNDREHLLNEKLTTELRPTLFLAQLSNLMAGNISIVHKVTGSSRTFMGEESAGISAVETAFARIKAGQSSHTLVGGALSAERLDIILLVEALQAHATGPWLPLWSRAQGEGGGIILGSVGAFLVLESREHAENRGARIYATIDAVGGDRGNRDEGKLERRLDQLSEAAPAEDTIVFSGASGLADLAAQERTWIEKRFPNAAVRGYSGAVGHAIEAQFPLGLALAALALDAGAVVPPFDPSEPSMTRAPKHAIVTTLGHGRGEGIAVLTAHAKAGAEEHSS